MAAPESDSGILVNQMCSIFECFPERREIMIQLSNRHGALALLVLAIVADARPATPQTEIKARFDRAFILQNLSGQVEIKPSQQSWRRANANDQLTTIGEQVKTGARSRVDLQLDVNIGTIQVAPSTLIQIRAINVNPDQSRVSLFYMPYGSARVKLRRFNNPNTRFEIETPAGVSGVRGTEFGVAAQPAGKTSVAVLDGRVLTSAQGQGVNVDAGFQNFTIPGEPPSPPVPLTDNTDLDYQLDKQLSGLKRQLRFIGKVDPVNVVFVDGQVVDTDRQGQFTVPIPLTSFPKLKVIVQTPLGKEQRYDLKLSP
jgi:FecR protein